MNDVFNTEISNETGTDNTVSVSGNDVEPTTETVPQDNTETKEETETDNETVSGNDVSAPADSSDGGTSESVSGNAPMLATQYARIWFATLLFAFIPPINDLFVDGKLIHFACATTLSIIMWCIFVPTIYRTFCKFAPEGEARWKDELPSRVFRTELRNYLRKNFPHLKSFIFLTMLFLVSIVFLSEFSL